MRKVEPKDLSSFEYSLSQMEMLFQVIDDDKDITVADGNGVILRVSDAYEQRYGISKEEITGKDVYELEEIGIFRPSVTARVLKEKRKVTLFQKTKKEAKILATGIPIFNKEGNIEYVISFSSLYIDMLTGEQQYAPLNELMNEYNFELNKLSLRNCIDKDFIAKSKTMLEIKELIAQIADTDASVLITGETGTGKSMIASIIHKSGHRSNGPFVDINCGVIPETLIESELFGYEKGAFTGANDRGKPGKIELANHGTLFLDEIGELPLNTQLRLLQVTQERTITRIGGLKKIDVDFRLISATNHNLKEGIGSGAFREDLFYRLNVIPIHIPPLRERPEDLFALITSFLDRFNRQYKRDVKLSPNVFDMLLRRKWPGNIRQVENLIERIVITAKNSLVTLEGMPKDTETSVMDIMEEGTSLRERIEDYERKIFTKVFEKHKTSISVAKALSISQTVASRRLRKYVPEYMK